MGKNIRYLSGKPLIQWTIEAALECGLLDEVIVSTDDQIIADLSCEFGAKVPFIRPIELATDKASMFSVVSHAIKYYEEIGRAFDFVLVLQPTSPLRTSGHINEIITTAIKLEAEAMISVTECEHSPLWANVLPEDNSMCYFLDSELRDKQSQELPKYYRLNGALYLVSVNQFIEEKTLFISEKIFAFEMSQESSVDIDSEIDFELASVLLNKRKNMFFR